jgi:C4-dicarboxylate transporter DctM subunit
MVEALLVTFAVGLIIGLPIAVALIVGVIAGLYLADIPLMVVTQKMFTSLDSYPLLAIPFFILAGAVMQHGGMAKRLVRFASALVGHISGGLALVTVLACTFFGALSGSAPATTAAIGSVTVPEMTKRGYDVKYSAALAAAAGILGILIPPSIPLVLYGVTANVSVATLFMGGIMPGIILGLLLMVVAYLIAKKRGYRSEKRAELNELLHALKESFWALLVPVIILGGIYGGVFTPTEAGVVASVYALFVGAFVYRELDLKRLVKVAYDVAESTATIMLVAGAATIFGWFMTNQNIPQTLTEQILTFSSNGFIVLLLLNIIFLVTGLFMNQGPAILILAPILLPVITKLGVDPVFYGIVMTMVLGLGQITPPVALSIFVASRLSNVSVEKLTPSVMPFLLIMILGAFILTYMPGVVMLIPNLLGIH